MPRYPDIEPYETGLLDTGDGNLVYWETCGNPDGVPALIVHGGPGSGCTAGNRRSFDPEKFQIIIFDQRNCGRSLPHASDPAADMNLNTTRHLLRDMEQLRGHLGVEKWLLRGGSWGVTLSLAYAERHPERVSGMLMLSVTSTRRLELDWPRSSSPGLAVSPEQYRGILLNKEKDAPLDGVEEMIIALHDIGEVLSRPALARLARIGRAAEQAAGPGQP